MNPLLRVFAVFLQLASYSRSPYEQRIRDAIARGKADHVARKRLALDAAPLTTIDNPARLMAAPGSLGYLALDGAPRLPVDEGPVRVLTIDPPPPPPPPLQSLAGSPTLTTIPPSLVVAYSPFTIAVISLAYLVMLVVVACSGRPRSSPSSPKRSIRASVKQAVAEIRTEFNEVVEDCALVKNNAAQKVKTGLEYVQRMFDVVGATVTAVYKTLADNVKSLALVVALGVSTLLVALMSTHGFNMHAVALVLRLMLDAVRTRVLDPASTVDAAAGDTGISAGQLALIGVAYLLFLAAVSWFGSPRCTRASVRHSLDNAAKRAVCAARVQIIQAADLGGRVGTGVVHSASVALKHIVNSLVQHKVLSSVIVLGISSALFITWMSTHGFTGHTINFVYHRTLDAAAARLWDPANTAFLASAGLFVGSVALGVVILGLWLVTVTWLTSPLSSRTYVVNMITSFCARTAQSASLAGKELVQRAVLTRAVFYRVALVVALSVSSSLVIARMGVPGFGSHSTTDISTIGRDGVLALDTAPARLLAIGPDSAITNDGFLGGLSLYAAHPLLGLNTNGSVLASNVTDLRPALSAPPASACAPTAIASSKTSATIGARPSALALTVITFTLVFAAAGIWILGRGGRAGLLGHSVLGSFKQAAKSRRAPTTAYFGALFVVYAGLNGDTSVLEVVSRFASIVYNLVAYAVDLLPFLCFCAAAVVAWPMWRVLRTGLSRRERDEFGLEFRGLMSSPGTSPLDVLRLCFAQTAEILGKKIKEEFWNTWTPVINFLLPNWRGACVDHYVQYRSFMTRDMCPPFDNVFPTVFYNMLAFVSIAVPVLALTLHLMDFAFGAMDNTGIQWGFHAIEFVILLEPLHMLVHVKHSSPIWILSRVPWWAALGRTAAAAWR